jgi:hypothetical protein
VTVIRAIGSVLTALAVLAAADVTAAKSAQASAWAASLQSGSKGLAQAQPLPNPPSPITATCSGLVGNAIIVSWPAVAHAASYTVYQATTANGQYTVVTTVSASPATAGGLALGTFFYKVTATVGATWVSAQSAASNSRNILFVACA